MAKTTCRNCERTVLMVRIAGEMVMTDPELISVVPATQKSAGDRADGTGGIRMSTATTWARRVHADLCESYKSQAARDKIAAEQREYNRRNGRAAAPLKRNHGL